MGAQPDFEDSPARSRSRSAGEGEGEVEGCGGRGGTGSVDLHVNAQLTGLWLPRRERLPALLQRIGLLAGVHGLDGP